MGIDLNKINFYHCSNLGLSDPKTIAKHIANTDGFHCIVDLASFYTYFELKELHESKNVIMGAALPVEINVSGRKTNIFPTFVPSIPRDDHKTYRELVSLMNKFNAHTEGRGLQHSRQNKSSPISIEDISPELIQCMTLSRSSFQDMDLIFPILEILYGASPAKPKIILSSNDIGFWKTIQDFQKQTESKYISYTDLLLGENFYSTLSENLYKAHLRIDSSYTIYPNPETLPTMPSYKEQSYSPSTPDSLVAKVNANTSQFINSRISAVPVINHTSTGDNFFKDVLEPLYKEYQNKVVSSDIRNRLSKRVKEEVEVIKKLDLEWYFRDCYELARICKNNDIKFTIRGSGLYSMVLHILGVSPVNSLQEGLDFNRFLCEGIEAIPDVDFELSDNTLAGDLLQNTSVFTENKKLYTYHLLRALKKTHFAKTEKSSDGQAGRLKDFKTISISQGADQEQVDLACAPIEKIMSTKTKRKIPERLRHLRKTAKNLGIEKQKSSDETDIDLSSIRNNKIARELFIGACTYMFARSESDTDLTVDNQRVVIARKDLKNTFPTINRGGRSYINVPADNFQDFGLIKLDLISMLSLDALQITENLVKNKNPSSVFNLDKKHDNKLYEYLAKGNIATCLDISSSSDESYLQKKSTAYKNFSPKNFNDLSDFIASIRLPMDAKSDFIRGRAEQRINVHGIKEIDKILNPTHGVVLYEDQLLQLFTEVLGADPQTAQRMRKALKSKQTEKYENLFKDVQKNNSHMVGEKTISKVRDITADIAQNIGGSSLFLFNKGHTINRTNLILEQAYYKLYFPAEYLLGVTISRQSHGTSKNNTNLLIKEFENRFRNGVRYMDADINSSEKQQRGWYDKQEEAVVIQSGLLDVISNERLCDVIISEREKQNFSSMDDLISRILFPYLGVDQDNHFDLITETERAKEFKGTLKTLENRHPKLFSSIGTISTELESSISNYSSPLRQAIRAR